jgi:hypothetical protein
MVVIHDEVLIHPACAGGVGTDHRFGRGGETPRDLLEIFEHTRTCPVEIGAVLEHNEHVGIAEHGRGAHGLHPRRGEQGGHDRVGNLILDDIGRLIPRRMNDHLDVGNVGQGISGIRRCPDAGQHQEKRSGGTQESDCGRTNRSSGRSSTCLLPRHGELFLGDGLDQPWLPAR